MKKKTLRMISFVLTLVFMASLFQAPMPVAAANTATIPVNVNGQTINVTPGQWVTVNGPNGSTSYNVRFVDGKPVALEMSQYTKLVFGDAAASAGASTSNAGNATSNSGAAGSNAGSVDVGSSNSAAQTSNSSAQTSQASSQTTQAAPSVADGASNMTWNEFQKANAGKYTKTEMSEAWSQYKAGNNTTPSTTSSSNSSVAQTSGSTSQSAAQTSGSATQAPAPQASVADNSAAVAQTSSSSSSTTQANKTSNWNPAKHPRDPQTGKFISHEEAIARGLMDPADANVASNNSSQSSQSSQTAQAEVTGGSAVAEGAASTDVAAGADSATVADGTQVAQSDAAAQASGDKGSKPSVGDKFKSGYQTGKNLTKAGFQNVKDSLKSGFSAKNLLVTAGITVGVDVATQVMRGEKPSLKKALQTVCCAEFVGSVGGSVLGSAAGSFFVPFLSCVPVVGGALSALAPAFGSVVGSSVGAYVAGDLKNGRFSIKEAFKRVDWVGVTGQAVGSTVGAALGSCIGPVGTVLGGMVGGYFGNWAAHKIAGFFGKGEANLPTVATPVGTTGNEITTAGTVTIGGEVTSVTVSDEVPVAAVEDNSSNETQVAEGMTGDEKEDAITAAYLEYTEYYTEYSKLIQSGKTTEALEVAQKMNAAKAKYDSLRQKG